MKENRTKSFLVALLKLGGLLSIVLIAPGALPAVDKIFMKNKKFDKREFKRTVKRLTNAGVLETSFEGEEYNIRLSKKGTKQAIEYSLDDITIKPPKKWDNKWRIVLFDIPEAKKRARDAFKCRLVQLDFRLIQKSVYILPYPCEKELQYIVSVYEITQYVKFIVADYIDGQDELIKDYNLVH